jgi:hypothetical protein
VIGVAVVAAALALMGAPASTSVSCSPHLEDQGTMGVTYWQRIVLGPTACAGILIAALTPRGREEVELLNPRIGIAQDEGVGLEVLLHEAAHASGIVDETNAQCAAMSHIRAFLQSYGWGPKSDALHEAIAFDRNDMPSRYHAHACH